MTLRERAFALGAFKRSEHRVLMPVFTAHATVDAVGIIYSAVLFLIARTYDEKFFWLGLIATGGILTEGIAGFAGGLLSDRFPLRRILTVCLLLSCLGAIVAGFSSSLALLGIGVVLIASAQGLYHPTGLTAISRSISRRARALGIHGAMGSLSLTISPFIAISLAVLFQWKLSFLVAAGVAGVVAFLVWRMKPMEGKTDSEVEAPTAVKAIDIEQSLPKLALALLLLAYCINVFVMWGFIIFLSTTIDSLAGLGDTTFGILSVVGLAVAGVFFSGAIGQFTSGVLTERFRAIPLAIVMVMASIPLLFILGTVDGAPVLLVAAGVGAVIFMPATVFYNLIGEQIAGRLQGRVFGIFYGLPALLGATAGVFSGFIVDTYGVGTLFPVLGAIHGAAILPLLFLLRRWG